MEELAVTMVVEVPLSPHHHMTSSHPGPPFFTPTAPVEDGYVGGWVRWGVKWWVAGLRREGGNRKTFVGVGWWGWSAPKRKEEKKKRKASS